MYDYRCMTTPERQAVVTERQSRGFPLHKPPHLKQGEGWYLVSAATFEHRPHFAAPRELSALEIRLREALASIDVPCAAWVVLPNHYHLLLQLDDLSMVGQALGRVHGRSSHYANQRDQTPGRQVWFKYTDRKVRSERHFQACLHYVIWNPVKHGYVSDATEWPWSCVHEWMASNEENWLHDLIQAYPINGMGDGWDD